MGDSRGRFFFGTIKLPKKERPLLSQIVTNQLANIKDPALMQWASYVVGAAASAAVGGKAQTGGSIAVNDIRNNWLSHPDQVAFANDLNAALSKGNLADAQRLIEKYFGISAANADSTKILSIPEGIEGLDNGGSGLLQALQLYASMTGQTLILSQLLILAKSMSKKLEWDLLKRSVEEQKQFRDLLWLLAAPLEREASGQL